jgi:hypothetical protein
MDVNNNAFGIRTVAANPRATDAQIQDLIEAGISRGELIINKATRDDNGPVRNGGSYYSGGSSSSRGSSVQGGSSPARGVPGRTTNGRTYRF